MTADSPNLPFTVALRLSGNVTLSSQPSTFNRQPLSLSSLSFICSLLESIIFKHKLASDLSTLSNPIAMFHTAVVNHLVRRTYEETTAEWTVAPLDNDVKTFQLSTWALAILSVTGLLYFLVMTGVRSFILTARTRSESNVLRTDRVHLRHSRRNARHGRSPNFGSHHQG